jgi:hypothetical protein
VARAFTGTPRSEYEIDMKIRKVLGGWEALAFQWGSKMLCPQPKHLPRRVLGIPKTSCKTHWVETRLHRKNEFKFKNGVQVKNDSVVP